MGWRPNLLAGLALAWGCEQWGAALAATRLRAESAAFTQPGEALCFQPRSSGCKIIRDAKREKLSPGWTAVPPSHRSFPEQVCTLPMG